MSQGESKLSYPLLAQGSWVREVHDRAPGVSAPSFLQELRLCGPNFPWALLLQTLLTTRRMCDWEFGDANV